MAVEIYLEEETTELIHDSEKSGEWLSIVEKLGLNGQKEMSVDKKSPVPFQFMNTVSCRVYETLCPTKMRVEQFNKGTIPLRALSVISLARDQNYFTKIEVWYDDVEKDPIAVGYLNDTYSSEKFIIARWGDELRSFAELKQLAINRWIDESKTALNEKMIKCNADMASLDLIAKRYFTGEWINIG